MVWVLTAFVVSTAFNGLRRRIKSKTWPGCTDDDIPKDRDWRAWHTQLHATPSIKVHVYSEPPFNWLHPVSKLIHTGKVSTPHHTTQNRIYGLLSFHPITLNKQCDVCLTMQNCTSFTDKKIAAYPHFKHSDDCKQPTTMLPVINHHNNNNHTDYFARQAKKMPSSDPANATIFLIPAFVRYIYIQYIYI